MKAFMRISLPNSTPRGYGLHSVIGYYGKREGDLNLRLIHEFSHRSDQPLPNQHIIRARAEINVDFSVGREVGLGALD